MMGLTGRVDVSLGTQCDRASKVDDVEIILVSLSLRNFCRDT